MTTTLSLAGSWTLTQADDATVTCPIAVPGDVHSALIAAKRIPDPYWGRNEVEVQWVGEKEWVLERRFDVPAALLAQPAVILRLEQCDTFAEIRINGQVVGLTGNSWRRYDLDVKAALRAGVNTISVRFRSAEKVAAEQAALTGYPIPHMFGNGPQKRHYNFTRKAMCHGGWDWGLALMVAGLCGTVELIGTGLARIDYVCCDQKHSPGSCTVTVNAEVFSASGGATSLTVRLGEATATRAVTLQPGLNQLSLPVTVANPRLWWPAGHGAQPLYDLTVTVGDAVRTSRLGLRTMEVRNQKDAYGTSMSFRVNGVDIFAKGANWIPADALPARQTRERMALMLEAAKAANMNTIRLWGGGQFEHSAFYELCDELGLLVWHDFMFSCSLYPADPAFLTEIEAELAHQLRRLRDHACIAIWCGDNECVGALGWFEESRKNRDRYLINYDRLSRVLTAAVERHDPARMFWPSSPCAGPGDFSDCWHDDRHGDMHFWAVWHESKDFEHYYSVKPRFCSEFGFQSFSSLDVTRTFCPEDQLNPTSPIFEHHQRNPGGNSRILETMTRYFRFPEGGLADVVYLSQLQQALAIKTGVEFWRSLRPHCMGTIFWQLNDLWPVASWASLEYTGKWKPLHAQAKRFYAPLAVVAVPADKDPGTVEVWVLNDRTVPAEAKVAVELWDFDGRLIETVPVTATVAAGSAAKVGSWPVTRFCPAAADRTRRFLNLVLTAQVGGQVETHRNERFFAAFKACSLAKAQVQTAVDGWSVTLTTDKPAFYAWANADGLAGEFDDNSLLVLPGRPVTLRFAPGAGVDAAAFKRALSLKHLRQTYA